MSILDLTASNAPTGPAKSAPIVPVLLSGGAGTRLWPLSRETYPKQFLSLSGGKTLLQQTAARTTDRSTFAAPIVVAHQEHRFLIAEQLRALGISDPTIVLEPARRNTAPAATIAALLAHKANPDAMLLVMPVDHLIEDLDSFNDAVARAIPAATDGQLVLFGVKPSAPATGYGYIKIDAPISEGVNKVGRFIEKPARDLAERLIGDGSYVWNSGIFLLPVGAFLEEMETFAPDVVKASRAALDNAVPDLDFLRLPEPQFAASPSISVDYAVLEKTSRAAIVPVTFDWNDIGSFSALWDVGDKDGHGNVEIGDIVSEDTSNCYLRGDGPLVAALGVSDLVVTATPDVVLVTTRAHAQDVGKIVNRLKNNGHRSATETQSVYRPWGYYQQIHRGERFQVKRITVNPGCKLSLQKHYHRAEHWVVVNGTALVTREDEQILLRENESLFIPLGALHRLENPGKVPLNLIEVQSGSYLGEDDIVRVKDIYNRPLGLSA